MDRKLNKLINYFTVAETLILLVYINLCVFAESYILARILVLEVALIFFSMQLALLAYSISTEKLGFKSVLTLTPNCLMVCFCMHRILNLYLVFR